MTNYQGLDIYCDLIISQKILVKIVAETAEVLAFHHTKPHWPVHIVVVPKRHVGSIHDLAEEPELASLLLKAIKEVSEQITEDYGACRVLTNLGDYQDSKHLHFHLSFGEPIKK